MTTSIEPEAPDSPDAVALVGELEEHLAKRYAVESRHGLSVARLVEEEVVFFVARIDGAAAGCGGVLLVEGAYAEVKRMWVRPAFRGRGLGRAVLGRIARYARDRGHRLLRLETGVHQAEAIALYERYGFTRIAPFGPYFEDPVSLCYEMRLTDDGGAAQG